MCGIFGYVAWDRELPPRPDLCRATNLLKHRGPDGGGYWQEHGVFLGHRRLSIIDLATGDQPMAGIDGRYVITFNGEIYNYPELRDELRAHGAVFRTASDTEVILAGYAAWGPDVVTRLDGMFAFAIYDRLARTIFLARDRFGEKPLLYRDADGQVIFASELSALVSIGGSSREIDEEALGGYLCLNYVPGTRTMLRGVHRVGAGEWRLYGANGLIEQRRYWSAATAALPGGSVNEDRLLDDLQERLDHAVRLTLRSDVPVGLFLSGGVDSSIVAESAARHGRLHTAFCVDFATQGFSEWPAAERVARKLDLDIVRVPLDAGALDEFLELTGHLDDPLADSSAIAVWSVGRAARERVKVVLSGDGGDELFGGYLTYRASHWHRRMRPWLPRAAWSAVARLGARLDVDDHVKVGAAYKLQRFLRALPLDTREAHFTWNGTWTPAEAEALAATPGLRSSAREALATLAAAHGLPRFPSTHQLQVADLSEYLANDILAKVDRATMAHGVESRAPLLNPRVAEFALALPERLRVSGGATKIALRRLCARHFGQAHAFAPKQGFSIPVHGWLRTGGRELMTNLLERDRVEALGVLDAGAVARVVQAHLSGERAYGWEIWGLMVLVAWFEQRIVSPPDARRLPDANDLRAVSLAAA